ncbi:hypothetical protein LOK46_32210 (plasmid) [Methylobacterium sp. NMS14P]|uniref:hypothetical protein n=1 Tax=Methylobacterium sp. NMS14P TaxID=2894310 RepID=UPI0023599004|nr:hypothetical protein [Methylobacterium sp. NMS14P]WCS28572.1 hypothetical protein LOK46_32210 [Methylobacterium sp. NMS14P]
MTFRPAHTIGPYLLLAELGGALFGGSAASAEERITLEAIGAVRMAGAEEIRRVGAAPRPAEAVQARGAAAERVDVGMSSHRD